MLVRYPALCFMCWGMYELGLARRVGFGLKKKKRWRRTLGRRWAVSVHLAGAWSLHLGVDEGRIVGKSWGGEEA